MAQVAELQARFTKLRLAMMDANAKLDLAREEAEALKRFLPAEFFTSLGQAREAARTAATLATPGGRST